MDKKNNTYLKALATIGVVIALIAYAIYVLVGIYSDVLITAQDRNMFAGDSMYFNGLLANPFGLFQYIGGFLTQLFYYPMLGAGVLAAIWVASAFASIKAFRLKGAWSSLAIVPVACLLASVVDLGYWIYCLNIPGYWFSQSVGFLCLTLLLWAANATPCRYRIAWYVAVGFVLFPFFGWFSYLFAVCLALSQFRKDGEKKAIPTWIDALGIALTLVAPLIFHAMLYEGMSLGDAYSAGFPIFKTPNDASWRPSYPFFILAAATIVLSLGRILPAVKKVPAFASCLVVGAVSAYGVWTVMFIDDNYLYEMQMTQAAMNDDWKGVVSVAEKTKTPSRTMVMLKNIALMNTGELGERSFELGNNGVEINNPDSLDVNIMQIASAVIYYNYGKLNYSTRWCMEFAVLYGFSPYHLKMMATCAELTGEKKLAKRYTSRLNKLLFYNDWKPTPASAIVKELYTTFPDALDSDGQSCERYLISVLSKSRNPNSILISEQALLYSMILRDVERFAVAFYDYGKLYDGKYAPQQYEDAYAVFIVNKPDDFSYRIKVRDTTAKRFRAFMDEGNKYAGYGYNEEGVANALKENWGGSYFWFNAFGRSKY